jgi:hypothetical protein
MTIPVPSAVRTVRIYSGAQMLATRGISPVVPYRWATKHPLDVDWWWVNATGWCQDIGDIIDSFTISDIFTTSGDGELLIIDTAVSSDGNQVGIRFIGGTPGQTYGVTVVLSGSLGADKEAFDLSILCAGNLPSGLAAPWLSDFSNQNNSGMFNLV